MANKKKDHSNLGKTKLQNLVAKHSRSMAGAGKHVDKTGEKAPRVRQKRAWKKGVMYEDWKAGKSISEFTPDMQSVLKKAGVNVDEPIKLNYLYQKEIDSYGDRAKKVATTSHGKDVYQSVTQKNVLWLVTNTGESTNESMIHQANAELLYENADSFDKALLNIEQEFGIDLSEGEKNFTGQQKRDMTKLAKQYTGQAGDVHTQIGNDLEMLEYQPDEIPAMISYITSQMVSNN